MSIDRVAQALRTTTALEPAAHREEIVGALHGLGHADAAATYRIGLVDGRITLDLQRQFSLGVSDGIMPAFARAYAEVASFSSLLQPSRQRPLERRALLEYDAIVPQRVAERTRFYQELLRPEGLADQQRLLVYDGPRFAGWVGLLRGPGRRFTPDDRRRLRPLVAPLQDRLRLVSRLDDELAVEEAAELVFDPTGKVRHASAAGRRWLELPGLAAILKREIRAFDAGAEPRPRLIAGAGASFVRLDGEGGVAYLVLLRPARPLEAHPLDTLPPSLQRVARALAAGLTDKELATELELPLTTARTYVTRAMKRLGVDHRAKLAILVQQAGRPSP